MASKRARVSSQLTWRITNTAGLERCWPIVVVRILAKRVVNARMLMEAATTHDRTRNEQAKGAALVEAAAFSVVFNPESSVSLAMTPVTGPQAMTCSSTFIWCSTVQPH